MTLFPQEGRRWGNRWWGKHSLSIVLIVMLVAQTILSLWAGSIVFQAEGLKVSFWVWWVHEYNISLVADTFGVLLIVLLSKWLYEKGSSQ